MKKFLSKIFFNSDVFLKLKNFFLIRKKEEIAGYEENYSGPTLNVKENVQAWEDDIIYYSSPDPGPNISKRQSLSECASGMNSIEHDLMNDSSIVILILF